MRQEVARPLAHPKRLDVLFHGFKTFKLIGLLLGDRRVPVARKIFFLGSIAFLLVILLFPDALGEIVLSTVLPLIGTVLGIPIDAGFDWLAFALVGVGMLRVFPAELVSEHYKNVFKKERAIPA